jgi:hypothetical protein
MSYHGQQLLAEHRRPCIHRRLHRASQHRLIVFGHAENSPYGTNISHSSEDKEHGMHMIVGFCPPLDHCGR